MNQIIANDLEEEWLRLLYQRVSAEFVLTRTTFTTTHQWVIPLAIGAVTAVLAFGKGDFTFPTELTVAAMLVLIPLVFRFFVRSCLEYTLFHRWLTIRNALDKYYHARSTRSSDLSDSQAHLRSCIDTYYFHDYSPKPFRKMIWDNLLLAFLWPFIIIILITALGLIYQPLTPFLIGTLALTITFLSFELYYFFTYR